MDINSSVREAVDGQTIKDGEVYRCKNQKGIYDYWLALKAINTNTSYPGAICVPINLGALGKNSDPLATEFDLKNTKYNYVPNGRIYTETKDFLMRGRYVGKIDQLTNDYITTAALQFAWPDIIEKAGKVGELEKDLETAATVNEGLIQQIDELKTNNEKENSKLKQAEYKTMFEEMKTVAGESKDPNKDLFDYIRDMKSCGDPEKIMSAITALKIRIKNTSVKKADVQALQADSNKRLDSLTKRNSELQSQNDKLKNSVQQLTDALEAAKADAANAINNNTVVNNLKFEIENLKGQLEVYKSIVKSASINIETVNKTETVDRSVVENIVQDSLRDTFANMLGIGAKRTTTTTPAPVEVSKPISAVAIKTSKEDAVKVVGAKAIKASKPNYELPPKNFEEVLLRYKIGEITLAEARKLTNTDKTYGKFYNFKKIIESKDTIPDDFAESYKGIRCFTTHMPDVAKRYNVKTDDVQLWCKVYEMMHPDKILVQRHLYDV